MGQDLQAPAARRTLGNRSVRNAFVLFKGSEAQLAALRQDPTWEEEQRSCSVLYDNYTIELLLLGA